MLLSGSILDGGFLKKTETVIRSPVSAVAVGSTVLASERREQDRSITGLEHFRSDAYRIAGLKHGASRTQQLMALLSQWVVIDPKAALDFLAELGDDPARIAISRRAIEIWMRRDQVGATEYVKNALLSTQGQGNAFLLGPILADRLVDMASIPDVIALLRALPANGEIYSAVSLPFSRLAAKDINAAKMFIASIPFDQAKPALAEIVGYQEAKGGDWTILAQTTPTTFTAQERESEITGAVAALYGSDPKRMVSWLEQTAPRSDLDAAIYRIALDQTKSNPQEATLLAMKISQESFRNDAITIGLTEWMRKDTTGAQSWAINSTLPVETIAEAILKSENSPGQMDFPKRLADAEAIQDPLPRNRSVFALFEAWVKQEPVSAKAWLINESSMPEDRKRAFLKLIE